MTDPEAWLSWPQAAELAGCPVPAIDWYVRQGRIQHRPAKGQRPSLQAASVEEFRVWFREQQAIRAAKARQRRLRSNAWFDLPEATGWLSLAATAEALGVSEKHVSWLAGQGRLETVTRGHRRWVTEASMRELARSRYADASQWLSHQDAATLVGCSSHTILRAVRAGKIEKRDEGNPVPATGIGRTVRARLVVHPYPRVTRLPPASWAGPSQSVGATDEGLGCCE